MRKDRTKEVGLLEGQRKAGSAAATVKRGGYSSRTEEADSALCERSVVGYPRLRTHAAY